MHIRDASKEDLPGILHIYNDAIENSTALWSTRPIELDVLRQWLGQQQQQSLPVLVALNDDGMVVGYTYYEGFRKQDGYRHTVESSVYVRDNQQGQGLGRSLLETLIERAWTGKVHVMVAAIDSGNESSIGLHESLGFVKVGLMPQVGRKFHQWLDLALLQLILEPEVQS